jgi:hypothetical protein
MIRRGFAGAILGLALLLGSLAWSGFLALRTVFEPDRSREIAQELLENDQVIDQLASNLGDALQAAVPAEVPLPEGAIEAAAATALSDPAVQQLVLLAFVNSHRAFLGDGDAPSEIDLTPVAESVRTSLVATVPSLAALMPSSPNLVVSLPTEHIPDASPLRSLLEKAVPTLALLALGGAVLALLATNDRPSILRRAGYWALATTALYLLLGFGLPRLLREIVPDQGEVIAALLSALLRTTIKPSIVLAVCGVALIVVSMMWGSSTPKRNGRREAEPPSRRSAGPRRQAAEPARLARPGVPDPYPAPVYRRPVATGSPAQPQPHLPPAQPQLQPQPHLAPSPPEPRVAPAQAEPHLAPQQDPATPVDPHEGSTLDLSTDPEPDVADLYRPRWHPDHGWVLHPRDPRPRPQTARWVDEVGWVVPGPSPRPS